MGVILGYSRAQKPHKLKRKVVEEIVDSLKRDIGMGKRRSQRFQLIAIKETVFRSARELMLDCAQGTGRCGLDAHDALHIAIAQTFDPAAVMVTSDGGRKKGSNSAKMRCACEHVKLEFLDPEHVANR